MSHRREVLKGLAGLLAVGSSPALLAAAPVPNRHLVLIELKGGNDALNAFPPPSDPLYRKLRPNLALQANDIIPITPTVGLNVALKGLLPIWEAGELALVQGVGYPKPMLSHFESARMWETGSRDAKAEAGWLSAAVSAMPRDLDPAAIVFGFNAGPLRGATARTAQLLGLDGLGGEPAASTTVVESATAAYQHLVQIREQQNALSRYAGALKAMPPLPEALHGQLLSHSLRCVAAMLSQPRAPMVYKLVIGGFDTHAGQIELQARQLAKLAAAIADFRGYLVQRGLWDRVLVVTYSEFGRRAAENASAGTDHGAAQTMMLIGGRVLPGIHGTPYQLAALDAEGNLPMTIDFREVFNAIGQRWMGSGVYFPQHPARKGLLSV